MITKKKLLFIQTQAENAGAQEISRLLGEGLAERQYEIHHLFFYRKTDAFDQAPNTTICCDERPSTPLAFARFFIDLVRQIRAIKPDVVLTFQHYGNLFGAPAARLAGVRSVVANQVSAQATMNAMICKMDQIMGSIGMFDVVTVNSKDTAEEYGKFPKAYTDRIVHVPHGFKNKTSTLSKSEAKEKFGLPQNVPVLGSVARLNSLKRLDVAVSTLSANPSWHLALGGQGPEEDNLRQQARELGVEDRLHFIGEMQSEQVGDFLNALDLFIFPSQAETFGLAAVEAAQAGLPVVSSDIPVLREVLQISGEPCALFANSENPASYVTAIKKLLSDQNLVKDLGAAARNLNRIYSLDAMVDRYESLINEPSQPYIWPVEQQA
jgi:glycosyltransferase involved in cell wall biosynthesis